MKKNILYSLFLLGLLLAACAPATPVPTAEPVEQGSLTGTTWMWIGFTDPSQSYGVESPVNYTLVFTEDGTVNIQADCNYGSGSYTADGSRLKIEVGAMTRAMCPPESRSDDYIQYLNSAALYFFKDGLLYVDLMADGGTMVFAPSEVVMADDGEGAMPGSLSANPWQWVSFVSPVEEVQIADPANYVVTFNQDGTLEIKADCNNAGGSYTTDGSSLKIEVGPMTMAACPPESRGDDFVKYLGFAAIYFFEGSDLYIDLMADGGTMRFTPLAGSAGNAPLSALGIDVNGEPFAGTLYVGGGEEKWLNPTLISTLGGTSEGPGVDVSSLGPVCGFYVPARPDVVVNWEQQDDVEKLRFFFLSMGDPSLMLVTPSGEILCSDDLNPLVLDPYLEVENPEPGQYTAFLGSYEGDAVYPGFLVVTSYDINPATMDLAQLFPREIDPRGVPQILSLDLLKLDSSDSVKPQGGKLTDADLPYKAEFTAGGAIGAFNLDQPNALCTGFISAAPTFSFEWTGGSNPLMMFFESDVDTTLVVRAPDVSFNCDDDFKGSENINPGLIFTPSKGQFHVWVGSFAPDVQASGALTITSDTAAGPTPLTSDDLK
jgi:heat shock protein HslJ